MQYPNKYSLVPALLVAAALSSGCSSMVSKSEAASTSGQGAADKDREISTLQSTVDKLKSARHWTAAECVAEKLGIVDELGDSPGVPVEEEDIGRPVPFLPLAGRAQAVAVEGHEPAVGTDGAVARLIHAHRHGKAAVWRDGEKR